MNHLCEQKDCTGCFVCADNCPQNAIIISTNSLGFLFPEIDQKRCVDCGICTQSCHVLSPIKKHVPRFLYSYKGTDEDRLKSSSGAFFPFLARKMLSKGYYICGVVFAEDFLSAKYVVTRADTTIEKMRKSKYLAADLNSVFKDVKKLLDQGEKVLFIGLPCHVAGLLKTVQHKDNLITVDLLCFGVGSPWIYKECLLQFLRKEKIAVSEVELVDFRHKPFLNDSHTVIDIVAAGNKYTFQAKDFPYYNGYVNALLFRESCYSCKYNTFERLSDITIGDALGHKDILGESIVFFNTDRGCEIAEEILNRRFGCLSEDQIEETKKRFVKRKVPELYYKISSCANYLKIEKKYLTNKSKVLEKIMGIFNL